LIGNKSDWTDKRLVTEEAGRELANELGVRFMETSAKVNEGVEEAFFTLARSIQSSKSMETNILTTLFSIFRDIKTRLIDSQADAAGAPGGTSGTEGSVKVNQTSNTVSPGCCS
jgi:Ras-related protein Rab-8A